MQGDAGADTRHTDVTVTTEECTKYTLIVIMDIDIYCIVMKMFKFVLIILYHQ